ncbi:hypothetical protein KAR91_68215 [Candidatus Pacearchaeota archaeon]|nr:hypothetical protein [Candidatus Pacearchaeota archaeon]
MNLKLSNNEIERINGELLSIIPNQELTRVLDQDHCDIEPEFLGFVYIYKNLSEIIPKHFTVVDLGCAYAPQAYYFTEHKKYIGIDIFEGERFETENSEHYVMDIKKFCKWRELDENETFAICNYVPPWHADNMALTREYFKNVFTFYPHDGRSKIVNIGKKFEISTI